MLNEAIAQYLALVATRDGSAATGRAIRSDLSIFCRWWEAKYERLFDVAIVVDRDIREWKQARQVVDGAAPATINRRLSTLHRFCAWVVQEKLLAENPATGIEDVPSEILNLYEDWQD